MALVSVAKDKNMTMFMCKRALQYSIVLVFLAMMMLGNSRWAIEKMIMNFDAGMNQWLGPLP
jgi:hypothetical protein